MRPDTGVESVVPAERVLRDSGNCCQMTGQASAGLPSPALLAGLGLQVVMPLAGELAAGCGG